MGGGEGGCLGLALGGLATGTVTLGPLASVICEPAREGASVGAKSDRAARLGRLRRGELGCGVFGGLHSEESGFGVKSCEELHELSTGAGSQALCIHGRHASQQCLQSTGLARLRLRQGGPGAMLRMQGPASGKRDVREGLHQDRQQPACPQGGGG